MLNTQVILADFLIVDRDLRLIACVVIIAIFLIPFWNNEFFSELFQTIGK